MSKLRYLAHHKRMTAKEIIAQLADFIPDELEKDRYGSGDAIESLEKEVADLLGKPAAVFMPSGTMAQQIALRIHSESRYSPYVAFHPTCHLEIHEQQGFHILHGLDPILLGSEGELFSLDDLKRVSLKLAALLIELPQREIGGQLPEWDELVAITDYAREKHIPLHMDGARLWEAQPYYQCSHAEIAKLFDSVYVSFYKGLGGIAGAILAGTEDFIKQARIWQRRHGGNLPSLYPYSLAAQQGLHTRLSKMASYYQRAIEIADILRQFPRIKMIPDKPQSNMMHVYLQGDKDLLLQAKKQVADKLNIEVFGNLNNTIADYANFELTIGDNALELGDELIKEAFELLFELYDNPPIEEVKE